MMQSHPHPVILFDGVCNLCNGAVQFVIKRDQRKQFRFAALQSNAGKQLTEHFALPAQLNTFVLLENGKVYTRSTAALRVARKLKGLWPLLYAGIIIPTFIRDAVYEFVSKNRYKWFGKKESCMIPSPELKQLFLNDPF
jgi:predicted DCC family thiol-disulfide oxidoreductase YuxK